MNYQEIGDVWVKHCVFDIVVDGRKGFFIDMKRKWRK